MSNKTIKKKGAAAAEDQGTPGNSTIPPAPDASSAEASRDGVDVDHMSRGGSADSDVTFFSHDQHQSPVLNPDDIGAMGKQLLGYADASSPTPGQRHHAFRIPRKRALCEETVLPATPAQTPSLVKILDSVQGTFSLTLCAGTPTHAREDAKKTSSLEPEVQGSELSASGKPKIEAQGRLAF